MMARLGHQKISITQDLNFDNKQKTFYFLFVVYFHVKKTEKVGKLLLSCNATHPNTSSFHIKEVVTLMEQ